MTITTERDFFDWLRSHQDDKKLTQDMVNGAKAMIASMGIEAVQKALSKINEWSDGSDMKISEAGVTMIADFEKYVGKPYLDAVGVWTIGYGNTYYPNGRKVKKTDPAITKEEAHKLKMDIINRDFAAAVNIMLADQIEKGKIKQHQFDALVSLAYNIGTNALQGSSVMRYIKAGSMKKAADSFLLWNKGTVKGRRVVLKGLVRRREAERKMFLGE